jgi:uncharacterized hydrophobic protein (TIGR00271 family)
MYKLTVNCSPDRTDEVVAMLKAEPRVSNVLVVQAVAKNVRMDIVTALIQRSLIDILLENLRTLGEWGPGELSLIEVDYAVRHDLEQLDVEKDDDEQDILGWELILERAHAESRLTWWYLVFMACAGLIAAIGLVANVPLLILGAMSLSPDLAPTNAMAITLSAGAWREFFRSLRTLALGLGVALGVAFLATVFLRITGLRTEALEIDEHLITFVTVISISTVIVALVAGVAAMTAFVTNQATTAVGVAISVTTIPAAAYAGVAMASYSLVEGSDALKVLAVNVFFLIVAQFLMLVILRKWRIRRQMVF